MLHQDQYINVYDLGLEDLNPFLQINVTEKTDDEGNPVPGMVTVLIDVQESLKFHRDLDRSKGDPFNQLFDADGLMTPDVYRALEKIISERYNGVDFSADGEIPEEDFIQFTLVLDVPEDTTLEDLGGKIWEETELVKFHNEADPGTFGSQYLFGSLIYEELRKLD